MIISSATYILAATIRATVPAVTLRLSKASNIFQEGYARHLEDIKESTDDELSLIEATHDEVQRKVGYPIGPEISSSRYHISIPRTHLTFKLGLYYPDIEDGVHTAFEELFHLMDNGAVYELLSFMTGLMPLIAWKPYGRLYADPATRRVFVGLLLCLDRSQFPFCQPLRIRILPSLVSKKLPNTVVGIARAMKHLDPIIKERLRCAGEHEEDWSDKPNDILLQWLIDEPQESSTRQLTLRVLTTDFASYIYVFPAVEGYCLRTKEAIALMRKAANFLVEAQRLEGILTLSAQRRSNDGSNPVRWNLYTEGDSRICSDAGTWKSFVIATILAAHDFDAIYPKTFANNESSVKRWRDTRFQLAIKQHPPSKLHSCDPGIDQDPVVGGAVQVGTDEGVLARDMQTKT
ncbi:hypothetical protein BKA83DRAFT_4121781 [Pisolithus microcarpus]|nr:hypothetical protein BKA83DRAFT_4121781 [Pisolithus microcarpus]